MSITFAMQASQTGGTALWSDTLQADLNDGLFSVELGTGMPAFPEDLFSQPLWLGINVDGDQEKFNANDG